jgi:hypothetical protein
MTDDLPTFGYPTNPTEMACLSDLNLESWRRSERSAPFPKGFVIDAWKARTGNSLDR